MVRLKASSNNLICGVVYEFQFQYGTIKSRVVGGTNEQYRKFQFQYGTIKSVR